MRKPRSKVKPRYRHDCSYCVFVGHDGAFDLWDHPGHRQRLWIRRFGNEPGNVEIRDDDKINPQSAEPKEWIAFSNISIREGTNAPRPVWESHPTR